MRNDPTYVSMLNNPELIERAKYYPDAELCAVLAARLREAQTAVIKEYKDEISELEQSLSEAEDERDEARDEAEATERENEKLEDRIRELEAQLRDQS
jgi:septal ring factor EnvC (AmiA/AmiB activator)